MKDYLTQRNLPHIFIIAEQEQGSLLFNRGAILNFGFVFSFSMCDYVVFHDVDYIPLQRMPIPYGFPPQPTHLSTNDHLNDPESSVGGVFLTQSQHQLLCGGWSNLYWSWGAEDTDMFNRVKLSPLKIVKIPTTIGQYRQLRHPRGNKTITENAHPQLLRNNSTVARLVHGEIDPHREGLGSLNGTILQIVENRADYIRVLFRIHNRDNLV